MRPFDRFGLAAVPLTAVLVACLWAVPAHAQQFPAQMLGTWQLNPDKSTFDPGPAPVAPATNITTLERVKGVVQMAVVNVNRDGERNRTVTEITLDGKEHAVEGMKTATRTFKLIDAKTLEWTQQSEGRPPSTTRVVLAPDGKTVTVTSSANKNTLVFDRQK